MTYLVWGFCDNGSGAPAQAWRPTSLNAASYSNRVVWIHGLLYQKYFQILQSIIDDGDDGAGDNDVHGDNIHHVPISYDRL